MIRLGIERGPADGGDGVQPLQQPAGPQAVPAGRRAGRARAGDDGRRVTACRADGEENTEENTEPLRTN